MSHLLATPRGITLAGVILAKRNSDGSFAIKGNEKSIHAQLQAAYGKAVHPQAMRYVDRGCELLAKVSDKELEQAAYPFHPNPHARTTSGNDFSDLTKGLMMFALTGLNDMENIPEGKARLLKMQASIHHDSLLKSYGLPTWAQLTKDDGDDEDDEDDEEDDEDEGDDSDDSGASAGGGNSHYNPNEPRIPAGQPGGGQWTTAGNGTSTDSGSISADDIRAALREDFYNYNPSALPQGTQVADSGQTMTDANVNTGDSYNKNQVSYADGTSVIDPNTGKPYPMPDGMDIAANVKAAENYDSDATDADKASSMIYWFSQGGPQDYQRPDGYIPALFGDYVGMYRNVTNYNYGAVSAAMGYSLDETLTAAGLYNQIRGNTNLPDMNVTYGIQNKAVNNITQGFQDYWDGKWTTKSK